MLILSRSDLEAVFPMAAAIEAVARGALEYSEGRATIPPRVPVMVPEAAGRSMFMMGYLPGLGALGVKVIGNFAHNRERGLPTGLGIFLLQSAATGEPLAVTDAAYLTDVRTGALTGAAARYLAPPDARAAALIGTGAQARTQLLAVVETLRIERVLVWGRTPGHLATFLESMAPRLPGVRLEASDSAEAAVRRADVAVAATSAEEPVLFGDWLRPGMLVTSIAHPKEGPELDPSVVRRADLVVVDNLAGAVAESTDLAGPLADGSIRAEELVELGQLVAGSHPGRRSADELILFKSIGFAAADLACGLEIYRRAREQGLGTEVELGAGR